MSGGTSPNHAELIRFVREVLGCGCPDEVVARTVVDVGEAGEPGLDVGGRLLVRVLGGNGMNELVDSFTATVERLCAERNRRSFNRLRMVVHSMPEEVSERLREMLSQIAAVDNEVYFHVVSAEEIPVVLVSAGDHHPS